MALGIDKLADWCVRTGDTFGIAHIGGALVSDAFLTGSRNHKRLNAGEGNELPVGCWGHPIPP